MQVATKELKLNSIEHASKRHSSTSQRPKSARTSKNESKYVDHVTYQEYPVEMWVDQMMSRHILPRYGHYSITYRDGMDFIISVMKTLDWNHKDDYMKNISKGASFYWCSGPTAREITEARSDKSAVNLVFISSMPNIYCLHNKRILIEIIQEFENKVFRYSCAHDQPCVPLSNVPSYLKLPESLKTLSSDSFLPKTLINLTTEELTYIADHFFTSNSIWIAKPLSRNCGNGIEIVRDRERLKEMTSLLPNLVIQKYIRNPLLLDERKSDLRVYLLLVCPAKQRLLAFYHSGFVRLSLKPYNEDSLDVGVHLTNQAIAKKMDEWSHHKNKSTWSPAQMNKYLNENIDKYKFRKNFLFETVHPTMKNILNLVSRSAYTRISKIGGCFEFLGCDFMLDTSGNVWLIEMNCYPGMALSTSLLKTMKPGVMQEATCIAMETISNCFNKTNLYPIRALRSFQLLWDSDT